MKLIQVMTVATLLSVSSVGVLAAKPEKTQGIEVTPLELQALGAQISVMDGYDIRARRLVINAGGTISEHSHSDRPGVVYILEGSMTEHRGDVARVVKAGDTWHESLDTVHWMENTSGKPCVVLAIDLVAQK
ncbi:cupin domain-containing protein [Marinomonas sp. 15G1-11]|uniref:Cupin domain-containing protein n=1 Tax=Marinomonas phaeophyticola TaxID=3004091 RepID=A0ABT4JUZ6_9GAMM|nr:cupin domain-containing protein [Marinomonas sp. 15G1-11]MCZ2722217.1 cupin domain-containing protein [Marinomonas sp. 15G1-11]